MASNRYEMDVEGRWDRPDNSTKRIHKNHFPEKAERHQHNSNRRPCTLEQIARKQLQGQRANLSEIKPDSLFYTSLKLRLTIPSVRMPLPALPGILFCLRKFLRTNSYEHFIAGRKTLKNCYQLRILPVDQTKPVEREQPTSAPNTMLTTKIRGGAETSPDFAGVGIRTLPSLKTKTKCLKISTRL